MGRSTRALGSPADAPLLSGERDLAELLRAFASSSARRTSRGRGENLDRLSKRLQRGHQFRRNGGWCQPIRALSHACDFLSAACGERSDGCTRYKIFKFESDAVLPLLLQRLLAAEGPGRWLPWAGSVLAPGATLAMTERLPSRELKCSSPWRGWAGANGNVPAAPAP
jgi:hypothetical protein